MRRCTLFSWGQSSPQLICWYTSTRHSLSGGVSGFFFFSFLDLTSPIVLPLSILCNSPVTAHPRSSSSFYDSHVPNKKEGRIGL